jgi:CBS domain-containing protein
MAPWPGNAANRCDNFSAKIEREICPSRGRVRHLPVMDGPKLLGVISIGDLVKDIISEQKIIIEQLEHYISGDRG